MENENKGKESDVKGTTPVLSADPDPKQRMIRQLEYSPDPQCSNQNHADWREDAVSPDLAVLEPGVNQKENSYVFSVLSLFNRILYQMLIRGTNPNFDLFSCKAPEEKSNLTAPLTVREAIERDSVSLTALEGSNDDRLQRSKVYHYSYFWYYQPAISDLYFIVNI